MLKNTLKVIGEVYWLSGVRFHFLPAPGRLATKFFAETASQLTFHGLSKLHARMRERELAVFFRNNHFCTIFKVSFVCHDSSTTASILTPTLLSQPQFDGNLYLLVTDCGYQDVSQVVWEKLDMVRASLQHRVPTTGPSHLDQIGRASCRERVCQYV